MDPKPVNVYTGQSVVKALTAFEADMEAAFQEELLLTRNQDLQAKVAILDVRERFRSLIELAKRVYE